MESSSFSVTTDTHQNNITETDAQVPGTMLSVADTWLKVILTHL